MGRPETTAVKSAVKSAVAEPRPYRFSARHLLLIGAAAALCLPVVREACRWVRSSYEVSRLERRVRRVRREIEREEVRRRAYLTPARIVRRARELNLPVRPSASGNVFRPEDQADGSRLAAREEQDG